MGVLLMAECVSYLSATTEEYISVDQSFGEQIEINVDIEFPSSPCRLVFFDVVDQTGEEQLAVEDMTKVPQPNPAAASREGCRVYGTLHVNKVAGNFHFALGRGVPNTAVGSAMSTDPFARTMVGAQHQHRFDMYQLQMFNASHKVHRLSFGHEYPLMGRMPLDGVTKSVESGKGQYNYYISVVPTRYVKASGRVIQSYQYSYTEKVVEVPVGATRFPHPGSFFYLSINPLAVQIDERHKSFLHFFANVCAIVGSVYVVSSFVDSVLEKFSGAAEPPRPRPKQLPSLDTQRASPSPIAMQPIGAAARQHVQQQG